MTYSIRIEKSAEKTLAKLERPIARRLAVAIRSLAANPRPTGCRKLVGGDEWRIRVGDYRVVYTINDNALVVWVVKLGNRRDVYER